MQDKTTIEITKEARNSLFWLKKKLHAKSYSNAVIKLAKTYRLQDGNAITLKPEIFGRLAEIKEDNSYDTIDETIDCLIEELLKCQEMNEQKQEGN